jgi:hypothetical protein
MSVHIRVVESAADWGGIAEGIIQVKIRSPPGMLALHSLFILLFSFVAFIMYFSFR